MKLKHVVISLVMVLSLVVSSCAKKTKTASSSDAPVSVSTDSTDSTNATEGEYEVEGAMSTTFEVNGSSDKNQAGAVATVYFPFNSSVLTGPTKATLDQNADFFKANESVKFMIEGHCDERGGVQYNLALGERRAKAIKNYLKAMGISSSRIKTISLGKEKPIAFGHDESAWSKNRRGNFIITEK